MQAVSPSDLKTILHSKRANLYYLEHCRLLVNGGRVEYLTQQGDQSLYWNIPIANTTSILLGTGTSITQAAMRELARAGVLVGFCGGGGTPLYSATEMEAGADIEAVWLSPQSEYRPTEYLQAWVKFWFDDAARLAAAKQLQCQRLDNTKQYWLNSRSLRENGFMVPVDEFNGLLENSRRIMAAAPDTMALLAEEGRLTKELFRMAAQATQYGKFNRARRGESADAANRFLDHGNYLAYGLAATATWVLGLPHGLAVLHGKTRRGGLVFDAADLVKDAFILPQAFISAMRGDDEMEFRQACIDTLTRAEALDTIIDCLKKLATENTGERA